MQFRKHATFYSRLLAACNTIDRRFYRSRIFLLVVAVSAITIAVLLATTNKPSSASASKDNSIRTKKSDNNNWPTTEALMEDSDNSARTVQRSVRFDPVPVDEHGARGGILRYAAVDADNEKALSVEDWIRLLSDPTSFDLARNLTEILKRAPYEAFLFETPGVSPATVSKTQFEFVLVEDSYLASFASTPNPEAFADYLSSSSCDSGDSTDPNPPAGCVFSNLGGDATLVAPRDWSSHQELSSPPTVVSSSCYGHLANFVRGAPEQQVLRMWSTVGKTLRENLLSAPPSSSSSPLLETSNDEPLWWSTNGAGVAWLHFRLDSRPKYYHYRPFAEVFEEQPVAS